MLQERDDKLSKHSLQWGDKYFKWCKCHNKIPHPDGFITSPSIPPIGYQVFKYISLWMTYLIHTTIFLVCLSPSSSVMFPEPWYICGMGHTYSWTLIILYSAFWQFRYLSTDCYLLQNKTPTNVGLELWSVVQQQ